MLVRRAFRVTSDPVTALRVISESPSGSLTHTEEKNLKAKRLGSEPGPLPVLDLRFFFSPTILK